MIGVWYQRTPADWPIFFLFLVMLPISIWAAPGPLRAEYSMPRALILIWNFFLFWTVVSHAGRRRELLYLVSGGLLLIGLGLGSFALLSNQWGNKFPLIGAILVQIPTPLSDRFNWIGTEFNPNLVAGSLLYILPLGVVMWVIAVRQRLTRWWLGLPLFLIVGTIGAILLFTQSRGALLGFSLALVGMMLMRWRQGVVLIGVGVLVVILALPWIPFDQLTGQVTDVEAVGDVSLSGRQEIWNRALYMISDFSFTGVGLGNFGEIVRLLYPFFLISPDFTFDHAHNFFLQMGVEFGIPGLVALLVIYLTGIALLVRLRWVHRWDQSLWAIGLLGVLLGHTIYDMTDAISMGSKPNFLFWAVLALVFTQSQQLMTDEVARM
ncbi:MAG: O-antigen ligase family protein [Caldilineaceae bacterium]|nr:O-antigen ligase family protein [Caldilineaceae bacterium]